MGRLPPVTLVFSVMNRQVDSAGGLAEELERFSKKVCELTGALKEGRDQMVRWFSPNMLGSRVCYWRGDGGGGEATTR